MNNVHFVGIEGIGMSGLANLMLSAGIRISGSDLSPGRQSQRLSRKGAVIYSGHDQSYIAEGVDTVVISEAIGKDNPEIRAARERNIPIWKYAAMLGAVMKSKLGLAVAGSHGKSTTTGMLAYTLEQAKLEPSFLVGARVPQMGGNSGWGSGAYFVAEACEYARSFLNLSPYMAIITNIEPEHLDYYPNFREIVGVFEEFAAKIPHEGALIIGEQAFEHFSGRPSCLTETYNLQGQSDWQISDMACTKYGHSFEVIYQGRCFGRFENRLPGIHNVLNSLAVIAVGFHLGLSNASLDHAIKTYRGVARRFDIMLTSPLTIVDDYAHHPTKIKAVLQAARERFKTERLWVIFQPHQASRTYHLKDEFARSFALADEVIVTDIFFARDSEESKASITAEDLVKAIRREGKSAHYLPTFSHILEFLPAHWQEGDVIFTMGAGNIYKLAPLLCECAAQAPCLIPSQKEI